MTTQEADPRIAEEPVVAPPTHTARALNPSAMRALIPATGLREYWYPALMAADVGRRKPRKLELLGTQLAFFRARDGSVAAVSAICPHRGADLGMGTCEVRGFVSCPYHGWTFDEQGNCVAALGEGPYSPIPGMASARVRAYPTRTLKGLVWVWMGDGDPAPIDEDVPEQFFDESCMVQVDAWEWPCNWRPAMDNSMDAHIFYLHRSALSSILSLSLPRMIQSKRAAWSRPRHPRVVNDRAVTLSFATTGGPGDDAPLLYADSYPGLGGASWPQGVARRWWSRVLTMILSAPRPRRERFVPSEEWSAFHLPSSFSSALPVSSPWYVYTRQSVPIDANRTRMFYFHATRPSRAIGRMWDKAYFLTWQRWAMNRQFSGQDERVIEHQKWDQPEKLTATDAFPMAVRRLMYEHARGNARVAQSGDEPGDG